MDEKPPRTSESSIKEMVLAIYNKWTSTSKEDSSEDYEDDIPVMQIKNAHSLVKRIKTENNEATVSQSMETSSLSEEEILPKKQRRRKKIRCKSETSVERALRLAKMSAYSAQRLANETSEQRAARLKRMSNYAAKRLVEETDEQRSKRLARMSAYAAKRLATETTVQRQARLARMSAYAARKRLLKKGTTSN